MRRANQATLRLRPEQPVGVGDDPDLKVTGGGQCLRMVRELEAKDLGLARHLSQSNFREADAAKALTEHERAQRAFLYNRERLKALRFAREATEAKSK
jgi:hypothetical protein